MKHRMQLVGLLLSLSTASATAKTILVDVAPTGGSAPASTAADFAVKDPNVSLSAIPKVVLTWAGLTTTVTDELANSYSITTTGAVNGQSTANNLAWTDNVTILEGYIYDRDTGTPDTVTISGMEQIPAGELITLTLYGIGDNTAQETDFTATYNGITAPVKTTEFGNNRLTPTDSVPSVQFTFTSDGVATALTFTFTRKGNPTGSSNSAPAALNGFSISSAPANFGDVTSVTVTPEEVTQILGAPNTQLAVSANFTLAGVIDSTALGVTSYGSSNPGAVTVSSTGLVSNVGVGTATVTTTVTGGNSTTATDTTLFTVEAPTSLEIIAGDTTLLISGFETNLNTYAYSNSLSFVNVESYSGFSYTSSAPITASVDPITGVITPGFVPGVATITASLGGVTQTIDITVEEATSITAITPATTLYVGAAGTAVKVTANSTSLTDLPLNGSSGLYFFSDNVDVATVDAVSGVISPGTIPGTANIIASFEGLEDIIAITVEDVPSKPTTLVHRYSFNNAAGAATAGAAITDSIAVGTGDGLVVGEGATFTGSALTLPGGLATSTAAYGDLPNGIISALPKAATFETWVTINITTNWQRVFDFGSNSAGEGGYGTQISSLSLVTFKSGSPNNPYSEFTLNRAANGTQGLVSNTPYTVSTRAHLVMTFDSEVGIRKLYMNGVLVGSQALAFGISDLSGLNDVNNYLGKSQSGDARTQGSFDEFRIYTGIMTGSEVSANYALGPDQLPGEGQPYSAWSALYANNESVDGDFDKDGVSNGVEYFMGETNSPVFTANPGIVVGKVIWPKGATFQGTYSAQTSPDLKTWTDRATTVVGNTIEYMVTGDPNERFIRLKVNP